MANNQHLNMSMQYHNNPYAAASPPPQPPLSSDNGTASQPATKHRRGYQACEACRKRKVGCHMGDPDKPRDGKCDRCEREKKECVFAPTRKKTRPSADGSDQDTPPESRGVKRRLTNDSADDDHKGPASHYRPATLPNIQPNGFGFPSTPQNLGQINSHLNYQPRSTPYLQTNNIKNTKADQGGSEDDIVQSQVTAQALSGNITNTHQTLSALVDAAHMVSGDNSSNFTSPGAKVKRRRTYSSVTGGGRTEVDAAIRDTQPDAEIDKALDVWSKMRFVKVGLLSAEEAMNYIDYFYEKLAPMTPIRIPDFRPPGAHYTLLTEEPVLALTILTITSRQMNLKGSGANSRSHEVHRQLWQALQGMVQRLLWGQEQFGGGFCGAGAAPIRESITGQITWKGSLRTFGTIEALLLLTDWQPRALHFPPGGGENDLIDPSEVHKHISAIKDDDIDAGRSVSSAAVIEPGWRSDRMSWMLLALAQSLSFELGIFDNNHDDCFQKHGRDSDCLRKRRLRRLVLVYVTQTSGRLGIKSMLSPEQDFDPIFDNDPRRHHDEVDTMQLCWLQLASIMFSANRDVFSSKERTRHLTASGQYKAEIAKLAPLLVDWKHSFDNVSRLFSPTMRHVLMMEYEYARMFINSVGFNKVVESWKEKWHDEQGSKVDGSVLAQIAEDNSRYIDEVKEAATSIVANVIEGFADKKQLANAAIRTYLRAFAGMVFTLKLFSLGNHESVIKESLRLLDRIIVAMEVQVVDDVHISTNIAAQVKTFVEIIKRTLIRIRKPDDGSGPPSRGISRQQSPNRQRTYQNHSTLQDPRYLAQPQANSPDDPLANIEARPIVDFSERTFIPPPDEDFGDAGIGFDDNIDPTMAQFGLGNHDWLALPLDGILDGSGQVEPGMSGVGPIIGHRDLLEWLEQDDPMQNQWNGVSNRYNASNNNFNSMNGY